MISLLGVDLIAQGARNIHVEGGTISSIRAPGEDVEPAQSTHLHFENALAFPGLINSHDHLDFNLFPRLGNRTYGNCVEWSADIHSANRKTIDAVLKIPKPLRTQWGLYKNLLNGVTTVVHHGERLHINDAIIDALQQDNVLHSIAFERHWKLKLNNPFAGSEPFVIHTGEGTDRRSVQEIDALIRWNLFRRKLIGIHGVAMTEEQAGAFAALVWCPDSNCFLLNRTADIQQLQKKTKVVFGTDSTLTAGWNLWEQLRLARKLQMMADDNLFRSVTDNAAQVWGLSGRGVLATGGRADIVVAARPQAGGEDLAAWFEINPADIMLVIQDGKIRLADESRYQQLHKKGFDVSALRRIFVQHSPKYVQGDLPGLIAEIEACAPHVVLPVGSHA